MSDLAGASTGHTLRVRLLQTDPHLGDVPGNLDQLEKHVDAAGDRDLVVAPELATHGYHLGEVRDVRPLERNDLRLLRLGTKGPAVVTGFAEAFRHRTFNSAALLSDGTIRTQRKLYLPDYRGWEERKHFRPGGRLECYDVKGTRLSMVICNDAWQPVVPWLAAHRGAEVLVVPTNSVESTVGLPIQRAWEILLLHMAVALQCYVVFVNRSGAEAGRRFWGGSRVIAPSGEPVVELGPEPGVADCELDLDALRRLRRDWPLLQESRAHVIAREIARLADEEF